MASRRAAATSAAAKDPRKRAKKGPALTGMDDVVIEVDEKAAATSEDPHKPILDAIKRQNDEHRKLVSTLLATTSDDFRHDLAKRGRYLVDRLAAQYAELVSLTAPTDPDFEVRP